MASDKEDFVYFIAGDEELGSPPLLKSQFSNMSESESEDAAGEGLEGPSSAVNAETGEINWDCPCLKSALEPPCGHTFKAALSCFVPSKSEPKGLDCQELFKAMQACFQAHPEKYGSILDDTDDEEDDYGISNLNVVDKYDSDEKLNSPHISD
jgi:hypothetical protein